MWQSSRATATGPFYESLYLLSFGCARRRKTVQLGRERCVRLHSGLASLNRQEVQQVEEGIKEEWGREWFKMDDFT